MPSVKKVLYFLSSALLSIGGVAILGYSMSADWAQSTLACFPQNGSMDGGSVTIQMGLFNGSEEKIACPRFDFIDKVTVFDKLTTIGGAAIILHALVLGLLIIALVGSAGSILITLFNTVSNPYETYMGPIGLFVCSGLSASLAFLALLLYLANMFGVKVAQKMVQLDSEVVVSDEKVTFLVGFYLLLPYIAVSLLAILLVYLYVHAAYTQRREQEKPTEDAPKDIMMY
ncbi:clarin-3 [Electrophorus electricus]|uniref:clarin-3 n=1 Tax=Electrophorus electricus TaxID=8005 RepID=UPI0015D05A94|nr:clarin-3 [Electrophorus electricus]